MWVYPFTFILPYAVFYLVFSLYPVLYSLYLSFTRWNGMGPKQFIGIDNYIGLFTADPFFFRSIWNTVILAVGYAPLQLILALILSAIFAGRFAKCRDFHRIALFMPYVTMPAAAGVIFSLVFGHKFGIVNNVLLALGIIKDSILWLSHVGTARFVTGLIIFWRYLGYLTMIFYAGIINISPEYYEAAEIDGASPAQSFFKITLPLLHPIMVFVIITSIRGCLQIYDEPLMLFSGFSGTNPAPGGPQYAVYTPIWYMYESAFGRFMQYGLGSAISYALFFIIAILSLIYYRVVNRKDDPS
jgi:multiple sugar transport system permease protein/cellobiose transport system permease protein